MVQRAFLWSVGPRTSEFKIGNAEDFANPDGLKTWARQYHGEVAEFLTRLPESRLEEMIDILWFKPPCRSNAGLAVEGKVRRHNAQIYSAEKCRLARVARET
jgi:hypothetical protein